MYKIKKRNGNLADYNGIKIVNAISKANNEVDDLYKISSVQIAKIESDIRLKVIMATEPVTVEQIQDEVVNGLLKWGAEGVLALTYERYRQNHGIARQFKDMQTNILEIIDGINEEAIDENSNKNAYINSTQRDYMAGETSKFITDSVLLPKDLLKAHREGIIHVHDRDYFAQHEHNCFTGGTKFVTDKGEKQFIDFNDGEEVTVRDKDGVMRKATVHKYEKQKMNEVTFVGGPKNIMKRIVHCTPNHRWLLQDGTVTTNLKEGDRLLPLKPVKFEISDMVNNKENAFAFCIGFIIGDGCDHKATDRPTYSQVRLCGTKIKYADIFKKAGFKVYPIKGSEDLMAVTKTAYKQDFLNGKGWRFMSKEEKILAFRGYYAADGNTSINKICTTDERVELFIEETASFAGYYISSKTEEVRDTNYKENSKITAYHFITSMPENQTWKVQSICSYRHGEVDAWCVEEPVTHSFTLAGGIITGNCDLINLEDMLQNGTVITGTMIEKPKSFRTAANVATQIVAQVASNQYGGQSFSLAHLAPFVDVSRKKIYAHVLRRFEDANINASPEQINKVVEEQLMEEVRDGIQTIQYQLVTLMTCNGQTPFVTMYMYLDEVPEGQTRDDLAMLIEEVLNQRIKGTKNEKGVYVTPAFPKLIYVLDEDNIHEDSKYYYLTELAAKCTAKRMVPDYISAKIMKEVKGDVYTCMGCRSFLTVEDSIRNPDGSHKFYGRFNQGVCTINLVDVACSAVKASEENMTDRFDEFWKIFDERLEMCHRVLQIRHKRLEGTKSDVAPILWQYGALARLKKGETIDKLLYGGYSTISLGYGGLYECCVEMTGHSHTDSETQPFALQVMQHMNDKCKEWRDAENIAYSLYGTPMESTTYTFAKGLQKRFGIIPGVTDHEYITNSYHVNVREKIDWAKKLEFESEFQKLSPGGCISYVEVPNLQSNIPAVLSIMKFIYDHIMYAELNTKSDYCMKCGYDGEIRTVRDEKTHKLVWECPNCGNRDQNMMSVARRTCGYIGSQYWNQGRTEEIRDRVLHVATTEIDGSDLNVNATK